MLSSSYIPRNDVAFCLWANTLLTYASANCERWSVHAPSAELVSGMADLAAKVEKCQQPTRGAVDTTNKNHVQRVVFHAKSQSCKERNFAPKKLRVFASLRDYLRHDKSFNQI